MNKDRTPKFTSPNPDEYWMGERIYVRELMNSPKEPALSLARCRVLVGVTTQRHKLGIDEWYTIESGTGKMELAGQWFDVAPGDCVKINAGQSQRIQNTGESDLIFLSLCRPRFQPETYENLEV